MKQTFDFNVDGNAVSLGTTPTSKNETSAPKEEKRSRRFALTSYIDLDALKTYLATCPWIQHWALCHHDKDKNDDGTPKEKHTHVLLYTYEGKSSSAIRKNFNRLAKEVNPSTPQNTLCQQMHDTVKMWRYLRHLDNSEKYQYPEEARICNDKTYWLKYERTDGLNDSARNTGFAMFNDMLNGASTKDMILRYGKEYIYHARHFKDCIVDYNRESGSVRDDNGAIVDLVDLFADALEHAPFNDEYKRLFFAMLDYVQTDYYLWNNVEIICKIKE